MNNSPATDQELDRSKPMWLPSLPWRVAGKSPLAAIISWALLASYFTFLGVGVMSGEWGTSIAIALMIGFGVGVFVAFSKNTPSAYLFTPDQISTKTLFGQQAYDVASIKELYKSETYARGKKIQTVVIRFKSGAALEIRADQISLPFAFYKFFPILHYHYGARLWWRKEWARIPFKQFGAGSVKEFEWYFERESTVSVASIEDICRWLRKCQYEYDSKHFKKDDFWQHPMDFEQTRKGDCEDHSLWAWRKLIELGIEAEFVVGYDYEGDCGHAWVIFKQDGQEFLFEATSKRRPIIRSIEEGVKKRYRPDHSVNRRFNTYRYKFVAK
jgi:transglutaminase-like putative cysteine protease